MQRKITGFHRDTAGEWVARLACGHQRHVRHNPPWMERPWVTTEKGRRGRIDRLIECETCDSQPNEGRP